MKKVLAIAALAAALMCGNAFAQDITVNAGYLQQTVNASYTVNGNTTTVDPVNTNGLYVGGMYNYGLKGGFGVGVGINVEYLTSGDTNAANIGSVAGGSIEVRNTMLNLEVPVFLNYTLPLGSLNLKIFAGPVFEYALTNKTVTTTTVTVLGNSTTNESTADWLSSDDQGDNVINAFNAAIAGGVAVSFNQIGISAGYSYGLTDMYNKNDNYKATHNRLFVGLTYDL